MNAIPDILPVTEHIQSVCIFGSAARASEDNLSDRDVLIVANDIETREQLIHRWNKCGWSVAAYSPNRIANLVRVRSLFIQHLKHEGIVISDNKGWLKSVFAYAKPKKSYSCDAAASVFLALPIERFGVNAVIAENLVAADLAYVAVRNFGICYLADRGIFCFDYVQIIEHLGDYFCLNHREIKILQVLRLGKSSYRKGSNIPSEITGTVGEIRSVLSKFFVDRPLKGISNDTPTRYLSDGYTTLRDFEARTIAALGHSPNRAEIRKYGLETIWKLIRDPRAYSWQVHKLYHSTLNKNLLPPIPKPTSSDIRKWGSPGRPAAAKRALAT